MFSYRYIIVERRGSTSLAIVTPSPNNITDESFDHDKYFERNFRGYVKKVVNYKETILPTFNMND